MILQEVKLINRYPRELARPFKDGIAFATKDVIEYIKKYGSHYGIHISVYPFSTIDNGKIDYDSAVIDKIFIDIDGDDWLIQTRNLFTFCVYNNDIISRYNMSGEGSHSFIFCKENIKYKHSCIFNFQSYLERKLNINIDPQIKGDLSRTFRIPGTFNFKRGRYCIPLSEDMIFNMNKNEIYEIAKNINYKPKQIWYGNNLVDLSDFDHERDYNEYERKFNNNRILELDELKKLKLPFVFNNKEDEINKSCLIPLCVRSWLSDKRLGHAGRFQLGLYLRDQVITKIPIPFNIVLSIFKNFLDNDVWLHMSTNMRLPNHHEGEGLRPIKKIFSGKYKLGSCYQLWDLGLCPQKCGRWHPIYE